MRSSVLSTAALMGHGLVTVAVLAWLALAPPARGQMLVILPNRAGGDAVNAIAAAGASLVDRGPIERSYIVDGEYRGLARAIPDGWIFAAHAGGCSPGALL